MSLINAYEASNTYISPLFRIKFDYPQRWIKTREERYEGVNGFFEISTLFSDKSIMEVCMLEAYHKLMPYGSSPTIKENAINDCISCLILPSSDQISEMKSQSALIVKYRNIVNIRESKYNYLLLWADKNHIEEIAATLEIIDYINSNKNFAEVNK